MLENHSHILHTVSIPHQAPLSVGILQARVLEAPLSMGILQARLHAHISLQCRKRGFYPWVWQGIFPTQGSNPGFPHCRRILYHLSHQGSLSILTTESQTTIWKVETIEKQKNRCKFKAQKECQNINRQGTASHPILLSL